MKYTLIFDSIIILTRIIYYYAKHSQRNVEEYRIFLQSSTRDSPVLVKRRALARVVPGGRRQADRGVHRLEVDALLQPRLLLQVLRREEAVPDAGESALQEATRHDNQ